MEINFRNLNLNTNKIIKSPAEKTDSHQNNPETGEMPKPAVNNTRLNTNSTANLQFNMLTRMEQAVLARELLNLPKEIKELLALLEFSRSNTLATPDLANELNQLQLILLSDIQKILNTNSKELLNKLIKLIQPTPGNIQNFDQLKEIITVIQKMIPQANAANNEILKNVILLYLPWLPLPQPLDITVEYEKKNQEQSEDNTSLIIYVTTVNLGRLKGTIRLNKNYNLDIQIESINSEEDIKEFIEIISKKVNEEIKLNKISAKTEINSYVSKEANKTERREVSIQTGTSISPRVLMAAYIITKVIFELDESISLKKKRESMVQEKDK